MSTKLQRIIWIDTHILCDMYPNVHKVMEKFGADRRIVFDDRRFMIDEFGAPIKYSRKRDGWYYTDPSYSLFKAVGDRMELVKQLREHIYDLRRRIDYLETENSELRKTISTLAQKVRG